MSFSYIGSVFMSTKYYIAYGSNMDKDQMMGRCPNAAYICETYIEDWQLTMPFYANIEPVKGERTPAIIWKIDADCESELDRREGYPKCYYKTDIPVTVNNINVSAMAYIMTDEYKKRTDKKARDGYEEQIKAAYIAAGFSLSEYKPYRTG